MISIRTYLYVRFLTIRMIGLYTSYNEEENGSIEEPIKISNQGYLIFKHGSPCKRQLKYPTKILLRVSKKGDYYLGDLLLFRDYLDFNPMIFKDPKHRPLRWQSNEGESKSVFFISNLQKVEEPSDLRGQHPPQGITYRNFEKL